MMQRAFFSAFAAILLSAVLVQTAAAVPSRARAAVVTVSETYNPLDFNLDTLVDGTDALDYQDGSLSFQVVLTGTFAGVDYEVSGQAGNWRLVLSDTFDESVTANDDDPNLFLFSSGAGQQVGTLTYLGGLIVNNEGILPDEDTPANGDVFRLFSTNAGTVLTVNCNDGTLICNNFTLTLQQDLAHIGPYVNDVITNVQGGQVLDRARLNEDCGGLTEEVVPCGSVTGLTASSVPEPATLALLGLGLVGLGLSRRARA